MCLFAAFAVDALYDGETSTATENESLLRQVSAAGLQVDAIPPEISWASSTRP